MSKSHEYDWKLLLLLSADIVGSTEYKTIADDWREIFKSFYDSFPAEIRRNYMTHSRVLKPDFNVWKYLGDEILLYQEIQGLKQVPAAVLAFHDALGNYTKILQKKSAGTLSLKGTAWTAGFPVMNAMFFEGKERRGARDFIGPSIDLGFRLTKHCETDKLVISVDLAYLLLQARKELDIHSFPTFHCDGAFALKGVNCGIPYPIIWLNRGKTSQDRAIDEIRFRPCDDNVLCRICTDYYQDTKDAIPPFIVASDGTVWGAVPEDYEDRRAHLMKTSAFQSALYNSGGTELEAAELDAASCGDDNAFPTAEEIAREISTKMKE